MFCPVGQQTYPTLVHVPWVEYTTVSGVVRKQVWSKSISWRLSILPAFLQQMTCLYSLTRIIFPNLPKYIKKRWKFNRFQTTHTLQLYAWLTAAFMNQFYDTYFCQPAKTSSRCVSRLHANWVWWCLMGIHPVILEFKIALKKQWSSKGCNIIPSQTKIENLRLHLHPALGFLSFRNSRPWWETPRRFPRSDGPKWLLFWMIIFLHYMIFLLHYQNHNIL